MCSGNMSVTRKPRLVGNALCGDDIRHGNIELRHLRYFVAVAEELNFHRAASRRSITQPPLTKQIAGLDEQVGVSLFARERQRIVGLTSASAEFLSEARRSGRGCICRVQRVTLGRLGRLRIGLTSDAATLHLTEIHALFHSRLRKVLVELVELTGSKVLPAPRANTIDLALASEPTDTEGLLSKSRGGKDGALFFLRAIRFAARLRSSPPILLAKLSCWFAHRPKRECSLGGGGSKRSWMGPGLHSGYPTPGRRSCWRAPVRLSH